MILQGMQSKSTSRFEELTFEEKDSHRHLYWRIREIK